jgi:hypothetical protein
MRILNRIVLAGLILLAVLWVGAYVVDLRQRAEDKRFYQERIAPSLSRGPEAFDSNAMSEWLDRNSLRNDNAWFRTKLFFGASALVMMWSVVAVIRNEVFWNRRAAAGRAADPEAGTVIREARNYGAQLIARTEKRGIHILPLREYEVTVDFAKRVVVFRGLKFIASFMGNKPVPERTLPFGDILNARIWSSHGHQTLSLRTTAGTVGIPDTVQPFPQLASVLFDIAEVNRTDPVAFAAALAREPKIKTPWYGWLIFAAALAGVAGFAFILWRLQPK